MMKVARNKKASWFKAGVLMGMTLSVALASVPKSGSLSLGRVTDDTALYQKMGETHVRKEGKPDFDADLARLSQIEGKYREKLPSYADGASRLNRPMKRILSQQYRYSRYKSRAARN